MLGGGFNPVRGSGGDLNRHKDHSMVRFDPSTISLPCNDWWQFTHQSLFRYDRLAKATFVALGLSQNAFRNYSVNVGQPIVPSAVEVG